MHVTRDLQECQAVGITCLSIAHRPALRRFHSAVVHFGGAVDADGARLLRPRATW